MLWRHLEPHGSGRTRFSDSERVITFVLRVEVLFSGELQSCAVVFDRRVVDKILSIVSGRAGQIAAFEEYFHVGLTDKEILRNFFDIHSSTSPIHPFNGCPV
jgi:hypothetical protein